MGHTVRWDGVRVRTGIEGVWRQWVSVVGVGGVGSLPLYKEALNLTSSLLSYSTSWSLDFPHP